METRVAQMSVSELRELITTVVSDVMEEKLSHLTDPDAGLELTDEFKEMLTVQRKRFESGEDQGIPAEQVFRELGLE